MSGVLELQSKVKNVHERCDLIDRNTLTSSCFSTNVKVVLMMHGISHHE